MKNPIKIISLVMALLFLSLFIKFKSNYGFIVKYNEGSIVTYTFSFSNIEKHLESLPSCYNESYRYDKDKNVTITKFENKKKFLLDKVYIDYEKGNLCDSEYILNEKFINNFLNNVKEPEVTLETCSKSKCSTIKINKPITKLLKEINKEDYIKENKKVLIHDDYNFLISIYYDLDSKANVLNLFKMNDFIILQNIDENDHPKVIKYNFNKEIEKEINNIIN